jgi:hypothetical protein
LYEKCPKAGCTITIRFWFLPTSDCGYFQYRLTSLNGSNVAKFLINFVDPGTVFKDSREQCFGQLNGFQQINGTEESTGDARAR